MTRTQTTYYGAVKQIAIMMMEDGYTALEVEAAAECLRKVKATTWDMEKLAGYDMGHKTLSDNVWTLDKVAEQMKYMGDDSCDYEDEDAVADMRLAILEPLYGNMGVEWIDDEIAEGHKNDSYDTHADVDDSWMDRRCYTTIRAKDAASGQRVDVDPPTWRDKLEMEHQLREDGYEFVDVTTDAGRLVILWYRPQMPRPMVDSLIKKIEEC